MGLWYEKADKGTFETMDLVAEFLDIWLRTRRDPSRIDCGALAGVIDALYEVEQAPGTWVKIRMRPRELQQYIKIYRREHGDHATESTDLMADADWKLTGKYTELLKKGHDPTPIFLSGAEDPKTREKGVILLDGRHRIYAACEAGRDTIEAYLPKQDLPMLKEAVL